MRDTRNQTTTAVLVAGDGTEEVVRGVLDLGLVDALARAQLKAGQRGERLRLRAPSVELCALLELAGLGPVFGLETGRQPELLEELGKDEVVQADDLLA